MGLGSYLAANTDRQRFGNERARKIRMIESDPDAEIEEIYNILHAYGPGKSAVRPFVEELCKSKEKLIDVIWICYHYDF